MTRSTLRLSAIAFASLVVSLSVYVAGRWNPVALDYDVFWRAMRRADPYRVGEYFVNPPPALPLFAPFRLVSFWPGYVLWTDISLILFFLAARRLVGNRAALFSLASAPAIHGLLLGQTPMILSAAILFAVSAPPLACGAILGCVAATKPQLLIAAPLVLAIRRDWRTLAAMFLGGLALTLLSLALYRPQAWLEWLSVLPAWAKAQVDLEVLRYEITPATLGPKLGLPMLPWLLAGMSLSVLLIVRLARRVEGANLAALMIGASILAAPHSLPHDLVGAMPALAAFIISEPALCYFALSAAVFCGAFLPLTFPAACAVAAFRDQRQISKASTKGTIQTTRL